MRNLIDVHYLPEKDSDILDPVENFAKTHLMESGSELVSRQLVASVARRVSRHIRSIEQADV